MWGYMGIMCAEGYGLVSLVSVRQVRIGPPGCDYKNVRRHHLVHLGKEHFAWLQTTAVERQVILDDR